MRLSFGAVVVAALCIAGCNNSKPGGGKSGSSSGTAGAAGSSGSTATTSRASSGTTATTSSHASSGSLGSAAAGSGGSSGAHLSSSGSGASSGGGASGASGSASSGSSGTTGVTGLDAGLLAYCEGHGAPILVGDDMVDGGSSSTCLGTLAQTTFRFALCTCDALTIAHPITTDSFVVFADGGVVQGRQNGAVGTDQGLSGSGNSSHFSVGGSLWVSDGGTVWTGNSSVAGELHSGTPVDAQASASVGADGFCASTVDGSLSIAGDLYLNDGGTPGASVTVTGQVIHTRVEVPDPCDCTHLVDIAGIVASHANNNDDRNIGLVEDAGFADGGLDPALWATGSGPTSFTFPCGRYFLTGATINTSTTWTIDGRTALMIEGDFTIGANFTVTLTPGSELDLFIAGNLSVGQPTTFGSLSSSADTRIYVGGSDAISLNSPNSFFGNIYAPFAEVQADSPSGVYGAIFSRAFTNGSPTNLHYDEDILSAGVECLPSPPVDAGPKPDAGPTPDAGPKVDAGPTPDAGHPEVDAGPQCTSCVDCGNQACINGSCGACVTSADCCAPLVCVAGVCQVLFQ